MSTREELLAKLKAGKQKAEAKKAEAKANPEAKKQEAKEVVSEAKAALIRKMEKIKADRIALAAKKKANPVEAKPTQRAAPKLSMSQLLAKHNADKLVKEMSEERLKEIGTNEPDQLEESAKEVVTLDLPPQIAKLEMLDVPKSIAKIEGQTKNKDEVNFEDLNEKQAQAVFLATKGVSFSLIGSAGSGKTTTQSILLRNLLTSPFLKRLSESTKKLTKGSPSVAILSFTNVAVNNIKEAVPAQFKDSCLTFHSVLEYAPVDITCIDEEGEEYQSRRFIPHRVNDHGIGDDNKPYDHRLPRIDYIIVEEGGSVDCELFKQLVDALPNNPIFIFLGDLNQLPPVYGASILGFAMLRFPVIELTETYRTADDHPAKILALKILEGKPIKNREVKAIAELSREGATLNLQPFTKKHDGAKLNKTIGNYLRKEIREGRFTERESIALTPSSNDANHNKSGQEFCNAMDLNLHCAQEFGNMRDAVVHEVKGRSLFYFAEGDLVFYEKSYWKIKLIEVSEKYIKKKGYNFQPPSLTLSRWGIETDSRPVELESIAVYTEKEQEVEDSTKEELSEELSLKADMNIASHVITLCPANKDDWDSAGLECKITNSTELTKISFGYVQSIHKSQGSEWKNVYLLLPFNTQFMLNREMLYTCITRVRINLTMLYEAGDKPYNVASNTFKNGVKCQAIKGNTLKEKLKFFVALCRADQYKGIIDYCFPESCYPPKSEVCALYKLDDV